MAVGNKSEIQGIWRVTVTVPPEKCPYRINETEETDGITGCEAPVDDPPMMCAEYNCPLRNYVPNNSPLIQGQEPYYIISESQLRRVKSVIIEDADNNYQTGFFEKVRSQSLTEHDKVIEQATQEMVLREITTELGERMQIYNDPDSPLFVGEVTTPAGQATRTPFELLREKQQSVSNPQILLDRDLTASNNKDDKE